MDVPSALVRAAKSRDPAAVAELLQAVWPDAYRMAHTIVRDHATAEDVAQDACAQVLDKLGNLRDPELFAPWFFRIVVNAASGSLRKSGRERLHEPAPVTIERASQETRLDLRAAIDALDRVSRVAIVLRYYYDLSGADIARITQSSPVTVRWRLMRAHRRLRALLEPSETTAFPSGEQRYADDPRPAH